MGSHLIDDQWWKTREKQGGSDLTVTPRSEILKHLREVYAELQILQKYIKLRDGEEL